MLIVLELLQELKGLLQSMANTLSTKQLLIAGKINLKVEPVMSCLRKLGDPTLWKAT